MLLPLITAVGVWGGFPKPPAIFMKLARNELFQYLLVFLYIYQSVGSKQDVQTSLIATVILFLLVKFLDLRNLLSSALAPEPPMMMPALPALPVLPMGPPIIPRMEPAMPPGAEQFHVHR